MDESIANHEAFYEARQHVVASQTASRGTGALATQGAEGALFAGFA